MSKIILSGVIRGAHEIHARVEKVLVTLEAIFNTILIAEGLEGFRNQVVGGRDDKIPAGLYAAHGPVADAPATDDSGFKRLSGRVPAHPASLSRPLTFFTLMVLRKPGNKNIHE